MEEDLQQHPEEPGKAANGSAGPSPVSASSQRPVKRKRAKGKKAKTPRTRASRPYPACSFKEALPLAEAIHKYAAGQKVRRLTLLEHMEKSPNSSTTKLLITNSGKYGITIGSYVADWLELTPDGSVASSPGPVTANKLQTQFKLAIEQIQPFSLLYQEYKGKKLPTREVMKDVLTDKHVPAELISECGRCPEGC